MLFRSNVHYLPATLDSGEKARFLATCDVMLHARWHGETFGLAVAEFAVLGKPVITYGGSRERAHLELLGDSGVFYKSQPELEKILRTSFPGILPGSNYQRYTDAANVMGLFRKVFLS